jgi:hypothetical protein
VGDIGHEQGIDLASDLCERGKSIVRGIAVPPQMIIFGRSARARSRTWSMSMRPVSRPTA